MKDIDLKTISVDAQTTGLEIRGCVAMRPYVLEKKCHVGVTHLHNYDHTTIVTDGGIMIEYWIKDKDGKVIEHAEKGPIWHTDKIPAIHVPKNIIHKIKALEDNTKYICTFSHRDFDGQVVEVYNGNMEAYS